MIAATEIRVPKWVAVAFSVLSAACAIAQEPVYFADANLKAAVEQTLGKEDPTPEDMLALTSLFAGDRGIVDLTGLDHASEITWLVLPFNHISDLSPLARLTKLVYLDLIGNPLNASAYRVHIPQIWAKNPGAELLFDEPLWRTLTISAGEGGSVVTPGEGSFQFISGETAPLEATIAFAALRFAGWTGSAVDANRVADPSAQQTTILMDGDYTLEAVFAEQAEGPVLGFTLGEFDADDFLEYSSRVSTNNTSEAMFVARVTGDPPDPNGMVRMQALDGEPARAKVRFGRCFAQRVLVQFQYLFESASDCEVLVYLSDVPELLGHDDPWREGHYVQIGRVPAPPAGRPGSFGSGRFGTFEEWTSTGDLDFSNGTWVELELVGSQPQAGVAMLARGSLRLTSGEVDGSAAFDALTVQVQCSGYCMDLNCSMSVTSEDILLVMASCGSTATLDKGAADSRYCLDGVFSSDGYVDAFDISSWDWALEDVSRVDCGSLCRWHMPLSDEGLPTMSAGPSVSASGRSVQSAAASFWPEALLILGKPQWTMTAFDPLRYGFYLFDSSPAYKADFVTVGLPEHCNVRLARGRNGPVYLLNSEQGVFQLSDSSTTQVIAPGKVSYAQDPRYRRPATVYIGVQGESLSSFGRPIFDVAFDAQGYAYVVPVVVQSDGYEPYEVAAKLKLDSSKGPSAWQIVQLYDGDLPPDNDNQQRSFLREIEIDDAGNVYLLNVHRRNESDILWKYGSDATPLRRWDLVVKDRAISVPDPLGLTVPADGTTMYLTSGQLNQQAPDSAVIYGLSADSVDIAVVREITINGMALVSSVTEDPATGDLWVLGFNTAKLPPRPGMKEQFAHMPRLARIPPTAKIVQATDIAGANGADLALPTSIVCTGGAR
ncbi:MAG: hypothetical protein JW955_21425 [Sedimentisphaerales bacterium]|nr:hypothetical protein [Sedimentisphaerales bacterium]